MATKILSVKKIAFYAVIVFTVFVSFNQIGCVQDESGVSLNREEENKAPDFTLTDINGGSVTLKTFIGRKVILLVFGTTWCPYCVREIPELKQVHAKYANDGLEIISVDIQESQKKVEGFVEENRIPYRVLLDSQGVAARLYRVRGVPTSLVIDKKGFIRERGSSIPDEPLIEALIKE